MSTNPATRPLFRVLAPLVVGCSVYLLVLLAFDTHTRVLNDFFNQELLVCIGISYLVLESNRLVAWLFSRQHSQFWLRTAAKLLITLIATCFLTSGVLMLYFQHVLGISNLLSYFTELKVFNLIFIFISLLYQGYFSGFIWLHYQYQHKIAAEKSLRQELDQEIYGFCYALHPAFLFSSLEHIILSIREQRPEEADEGIMLLAELYRHFLHQQQELIPLQEELVLVAKLHRLLEKGGKHIRLKLAVQEAQVLLPPGCLLRVVEAIAQTQLSSINAPLQLELQQQQNNLQLSFEANASLTSTTTLQQLLESLQQQFSSSTGGALRWNPAQEFVITLPTATLVPHESHYY